MDRGKQNHGLNEGIAITVQGNLFGGEQLPTDGGTSIMLSNQIPQLLLASNDSVEQQPAQLIYSIPSFSQPVNNLNPPISQSDPITDGLPCISSAASLNVSRLLQNQRAVDVADIKLVSPKPDPAANMGVRSHIIRLPEPKPLQSQEPNPFNQKCLDISKGFGSSLSLGTSNIQTEQIMQPQVSVLNQIAKSSFVENFLARVNPPTHQASSQSLNIVSLPGQTNSELSAGEPNIIKLKTDTPEHFPAPRISLGNKAEEKEQEEPVITKLEEKKSVYNDDLIWCNDCQRSQRIRCKKHGPTLTIKDRAIPSRARLTLPHQFTVKTVELRADGNDVVGVFAKKIIQTRTQFGPFEGNLIDDPPRSSMERLQLKIFHKDGDESYLDTAHESMCNWMMLVRPATWRQEINAVAYQYHGQIYFLTTKAITPNSELKVWYAKDYAIAMQEKMLPKRTEPQEDQPHYDPDLSFDQISAENYETEGAEMSEEDDHIDDDVASEGELKVEVKPEAGDTSNGEEKSLAVDEKIDEETAVAENGLITIAPQENQHEVEEESMETGIESPTKENPEMQDDDTPTLRRTTRKRKGKYFTFIKAHKKDPEKAKGLIKLPAPRKVLKIKMDPDDDYDEPKRRGKRRKDVKQERQCFNCEHCDLIFPNRRSLKAHTYTHLGEKPFPCNHPSCDKAFTSKFKLQRHELIHGEDKQYCCNYCLKTFARKDHLKTHLRVHDPNKALFSCSMCGKEYASAYAYKTHMAFHAARDGDLTCRVCKQEFNDSQSLYAHLKIHSGARSVKDASEKKNQCPLCNKNFFTKKDVRRHLVVHTKEREFLCQYCPQRFGRRDHLVRHLRTTHSNDSTGVPNKGKSPNLENPRELTPIKPLLIKAMEDSAGLDQPQTIQDFTITTLNQPDPSSMSGGQIIQKLNPNQLPLHILQQVRVSMDPPTQQGESLLSGHFIPPAITSSPAVSIEPIGIGDVEALQRPGARVEMVTVPEQNRVNATNKVLMKVVQDPPTDVQLPVILSNYHDPMKVIGQLPDDTT